MFIKTKIILLFLVYATVFGLEEGDETILAEGNGSVGPKESTDTQNNEGKFNDLKASKQNPLQRSSTCGQRPSEEIVSSMNSVIGEFPWIVGIYSQNGEPDAAMVHECGGALLAPNAVLTSAHCVHQFKRNLAIKVQLGFKDTVESRAVKKIIMLDHFELNYHLNDIAVVILNEPFELKEHIQPVCLPPINANFDGQNCLLLHYNSTYEVGYQKFDFKVLTERECSLKLRQLNRKSELPLDESIICATSPTTQELCQNMLGSPLICPISGYENRYYLAGITSFGEGCADETHMELFLNVALFSRWIEFILKQENIDKYFFTF